MKEGIDMFEKQIDRAEAFRLANTGMRVKVLVPGPKGSEWEEARTTTLSAYLEGCLFFRDEPAGVNPDFEAAVPPPTLMEQLQGLPLAPRNRPPSVWVPVLNVNENR